MKNAFFYETPLGIVWIAENGNAITNLVFGRNTSGDFVERETSLLKKAASQLREYMGGSRKAFDLEYAAEGTEFERSVWGALLKIPYGVTKTYGEIAAQIGNPKACRAVGMANGRNPISVFIPCHRVIGADGSLTGYAGGLHLKTSLLQIEKILK